MPRISITVKNAFVYFILLVLTSVILGYSIYKISSNKILENATLSLNHNNESVVTQFRTSLVDIRKDLLFMSKNPFLHEFIRNPGDQILKYNLANEFLALLSTNKKYLQVRLIGVEDSGREIIRAEKFANGPALVEELNLQMKGDRDYFIETIRLKEDSIYYSEINLNQEYGKIILPMVPTMRMAKPVYSGSQLYGILIINIDLSYVFDELKKIAGPQYTLTLFNKSGYYLIHPDSSKLYGFEFGKSPEINLLKLANDKKELQKEQIESNELFSIIEYSYPRAGYHLFFSLSADREILLSVFNQWKSDLFLLTIIMTFLSLAIAILWTQRQTKVFKSLTNTIINFGKNPENIMLQINRDDEIGDLSKSFREMANRINQHLKELEIAKAEAIDANKAKQEFLENMSHEIRNPLQSILGMCGMLLQNNPRPDQQAFIETLKFSSENLLTLVNDILDYRKLIHGQIELKYQDIALGEYLDNIIKSHLFDAVNKKVKLRLELSPSLKEKLFSTDSVRLSQVLHNLISNAIRNTPQGKLVQLRVNAVAESQIEFEIADQGIGISAENIQNILNQKPVTGNSSQIQNVGLGLPIVINLLKLFNTELRIGSEPGNGSKFVFVLTSRLLEIPKKLAIRDESVNYLDAYLNAVACIEDDIQNSFYYSEIFKKIGIGASLFSSPEELLQKTGSKYDLIITDLNFTHAHLKDYCQLIRNFLTDKGILFVVSAIDDADHSLAKTEFSYDASFVKPVSSEMLLNQLTALVFERHFEKPTMNKLYLNYDYQPDKVQQALELTIREWKEMFEKLITAIRQKDISQFDKVYHKLINTMRSFELESLQKKLMETRAQLPIENSRLDLLVHQVSLPFSQYLKIFLDELNAR